jgi:glycosyltransferase involved in cell wall biosynthesis
MKVFFLPRWFPIAEDPLWGLFVLRHALAVARFAEVYVIYVDKSDNPDRCKQPEFAVLEGVPVLYWFYRSSRLPGVGKLMMVFRMLFAWHRAYRLAIKTWGKPDLNHVHILTRMGLMALIVKIRYAIPYVITEHWSRYLPQNMYYTGWLRRWITPLVVRKAGAVMPVSAHLAKAMQGVGLLSSRYFVVPNVVDTDLFRIKPTLSQKQRFRFLHISTFDDRAKNIRGILRVAARIQSASIPFELRLIGDGIDYTTIREMAAALNLSGQVVVFKGAMDPQGIVEELGEADILLLFSNYENQPVVIPEAFACGKPVIATNVGGIGEIVDESNGFLIERGDEEGLYHLMVNLIQNGTHQFHSNQIRANCITQFSEPVVGEQIITLYNMVTKQPDHV